MTAKAILFDKDGTLMDFDAFWIAVTVHALQDILKQINRTDIPLREFFAAFGVKNGKADTDGILCKGTYAQMGHAIYRVLQAHHVPILLKQAVQMTENAYNRNLDKGEIKPTCKNIRAVLERLKSGGTKLLVVTTDNAESTYMCLEKLGILDLFEQIITDDGKFPAKPNPECVFKFSASSGIPLNQIVMVGDTETDLQFARNAGIFFIGICAESAGNAQFSACADALIPDISHLYDVLKEKNHG